MADLRATWRQATTAKKLAQYVSDDPSLPHLPYAGFDRTRIPATPDILIKDGTGFLTGMFAGKDVKPKRTPLQALGDNPGPAYMSYGRALYVFGFTRHKAPRAARVPRSDDAAQTGPAQTAIATGSLPTGTHDADLSVSMSHISIAADEPHTDEPKISSALDEPRTELALDEQTIEPVLDEQKVESALVEQKTELAMGEQKAEPALDKSEAEPALDESIVEAALDGTAIEHDADGPKTEREYRDKYCSPTKLISDDLDPWKSIFSARKFGPYLPLLCRQYVKLVHAKDNGTSLFGYEGWPDVDGLDFNGLVNWVLRCTESDPNFRDTLDEWEEAADLRAAQLAKKLDQANVMKDFNDTKLKMGNATDYWKYTKKSILSRDLDKMKINYKPASRTNP